MPMLSIPFLRDEVRLKPVEQFLSGSGHTLERALQASILHPGFGIPVKIDAIIQHPDQLPHSMDFLGCHGMSSFSADLDLKPAGFMPAQKGDCGGSGGKDFGTFYRLTCNLYQVRRVKRSTRVSYRAMEAVAYSFRAARIAASARRPSTSCSLWRLDSFFTAHSARSASPRLPTGWACTSCSGPRPRKHLAPLGAPARCSAKRRSTSVVIPV